MLFRTKPLNQENPRITPKPVRPRHHPSKRPPAQDSVSTAIDHPAPMLQGCNMIDVAAHYAQDGLLDRILQAFIRAGKSIDHLTIDDLAAVDEFHSRRRRGTADLARMLAPKSSDHVIDIGSGIGGPARYLAQTFGCQVSGVDLTEAFVTTAIGLTQRVGLTALVDFHHGSALALPFPDATFDLAWSQNVAMNIADRPLYYGEMRRVLKPGGRVAIQDVTQGPGGPVIYPVMWASRPELSFLRTAEQTRSVLEAAGFTILQWIDNSETSIAEAAAERAQMKPGAPPPELGVELIVGPTAREKMRNGQRNQEEHRIRLINAILQRA
jgi:ubiquinone/menaquinone biosynthesis C-methylase UbiE